MCPKLLLFLIHPSSGTHLAQEWELHPEQRSAQLPCLGGSSRTAGRSLGHFQARLDT